MLGAPTDGARSRKNKKKNSGGVRIKP